MNSITTVSGALLIGACSLFSSSAIADTVKRWGDLPKVSKPTHEGFQDELAKSQRYLNFGNRSTRLPGGSLLYIPEAMAERVTEQPHFPLTPWRDFLRSNPSWLRTVTVEWKQVLGEKELPPELEESFADFNSITIATYRHFPITVHRRPVDTTLTDN